MTNFQFQTIYSLLGKNLNYPDAKELFEIIHKDYKDFFIIHEPLKEDIENKSDNWKTYDSQELGIVIEVFCERVVSVSFSRGGTFYNEPFEGHAYPYSLYNNLKLGTKREEIRVFWGTPNKVGDFFDQYKINDNITMGILYNMKNYSANTVSFGLTEIFSNPGKSPNRFSFIFMSLS
jgi:hypothetical protein